MAEADQAGAYLLLIGAGGEQGSAADDLHRSGHVVDVGNLDGSFRGGPGRIPEGGFFVEGLVSGDVQKIAALGTEDVENGIGDLGCIDTSRLTQAHGGQDVFFQSFGERHAGDFFEDAAEQDVVGVGVGPVFTRLEPWGGGDADVDEFLVGPLAEGVAVEAGGDFGLVDVVLVAGGHVG